MPKRRMTPARKRQIAQWQAAGAKARKTGYPMGKIVTLEHRTLPKYSQNILKTQQWQADSYTNNHVFFFRPRDTKKFIGFGSSVVTVRVNHKVIKRDNTHPDMNKISSGSLMVHMKDLEGIKIRRAPVRGSVPRRNRKRS